MTEVIASFAEVSGRYDAAFVDLWGCMHNGLEAFPDAVEAMRAFRAQGGRVVLVTNAPRPRASVEAQIERMGIPRDSWDAIATSGDAARVALFQGAVGSRIWFMGAPTDRVFLEPPRIVATGRYDASVVVKTPKGWRFKSRSLKVDPGFFKWMEQGQGKAS